MNRRRYCAIEERDETAHRFTEPRAGCASLVAEKRSALPIKSRRSWNKYTPEPISIAQKGALLSNRPLSGENKSHYHPNTKSLCSVRHRGKLPTDETALYSFINIHPQHFEPIRYSTKKHHPLAQTSQKRDSRSSQTHQLPGPPALHDISLSSQPPGSAPQAKSPADGGTLFTGQPASGAPFRTNTDSLQLGEMR